MAKVLKKGGRPRGFDRAVAVETAMRLFHRHGYEGVSLAMLTEAIGVAPPSIYAAFGSKAGLYHEALDRYAELAPLSLVEDDAQSLTLDQALARMLERAIQIVAGHGHERGCMISIGLLTHHPDHDDLAEDLRGRRAALACRLSEELGHWLPRDRCDGIALFLCAVLQGMAVQAKDGAPQADLRTIATTARRCVSQWRLPP